MENKEQTQLLYLLPAPVGVTFAAPPGMVFTGEVVCDKVCNVLPCFETAPPSPGKLSINTLEGWNALSRQGWIKHARRRFGREPTEGDIEEQKKLESRLMYAKTEEEIQQALNAAFGRR